MLAQIENGSLIDQKIRSESTCENSISELVSLYKTKNNFNRTYAYAELDSIVGIQVNLLFSPCRLSVTGLLKYANGLPVRIPPVSKDLIVKKLQKSLEGKITFSVVGQLNALKLQSDTKLPSNQEDVMEHMTQHLKSVMDTLPKIYAQLSVLGIGRKTQKGYLNFLKKKLQLHGKVSKILHNQLKEIQPQTKSENDREGSVFRFYDKIEPYVADPVKGTHSQQETCQDNLIREGGFSQVQKRKCLVSEVFIGFDKKNKFVDDLAVKTMRNDQMHSLPTYQRIQKQYRTLNKILDPKYTLDYWVKLTHPSGNLEQIFKNWSDMNQMYIQYVEETMGDFIQNPHRTIEQIVEYSQQIVEGIQILHRSGIVHRDMKPDNILLEILDDGKKRIKIIDFSESIFTQTKYDEKISNTLGATMPYSPIECYIANQQSFNSPQIDIWSVGMILIELILGFNPVSYSKCFGMDIYKGWKIPNQFGIIYPIKTRTSPIGVVQSLFTLIATKSICINQQKRMKLSQMKMIIQEIQNYLQYLKN